VFIKLFLLFTCIPIVELYFLMKLGSVVGAFNTILLVLITGALGASLAKTQGFMIISQIKDMLSKGELPAEEMVEGLLILIGGVALLTPGLITDITGLAIIAPFTRKPIAAYLMRYFSDKIDKNNESQVIIDITSD